MITLRPLAALLVTGSLFSGLSACSGESGPGLGAGFQVLDDAIDGTGRPRRVEHLATGIVLRLVDSGSCAMGTPESEAKRDGDEVQYVATLEDPYYLGETEVTAGQWLAVMGEAVGGSDESESDTDSQLPAGGISWHMAATFVDTLNENHDGGWSLPTEAQWEYACRSGTTTPFSFGETITPELVNYHGRYPYGDAERGLERNGPVPAGSLPANPWGFHEMHGNLWEWCEDVYNWDPTSIPSGQSSDGASRSIRGGAWTSAAKECRSGFREGYAPSSDGPKYGLRVVRAVGS